MRRALILSVACGLVGGYVWVAMVSMIYCVLIGRLDLFVPPFMQWVAVAPDWRANSATMTCFLIAPVLPTLLVVLPFGAIIVRQIMDYAGGHQQQSVYGKTGWATSDEMQRGGIERSRKL